MYNDLKNNKNDTLNKIIQSEIKTKDRIYEIKYPIIEKKIESKMPNLENLTLKEDNKNELTNEVDDGFTVVKKKNNKFQHN